MAITTSGAAHTIRSMYEAGIAGDMEAFFGFIDEGFVLHEPPFLPYGGTYEGRDGFAGLFAAATKVVDFSTLEIDYVFGDDERACAAVSLQVAGTEHRATVVEEWIARDGKVQWGRVFWFDPSLLPG